MARTRSRLGNSNKNQQPKPPVVEHAPEAVSIVEPVTMVMIRALLVEHGEELRELIRENIREPIASVMQCELNEYHLDEGNYSRTVSQAEPQRVRRNNPDNDIEMDRCKYKYFISAKP